MQIEQTSIPGLLIMTPPVFSDERGFFFESFNQRSFAEATGLTLQFVQDNHSRSAKGVLRGLHYQAPPYAQGKLVRCSSGRVWDVAVDLRRASPTFGQWFGLDLSAENKKQLWIPEGMAHGFLAQTQGAELLYKTTDYYEPSSDRAIRWNDPQLGIKWPLEEPPDLSPKDREAPFLAENELFP